MSEVQQIITGGLALAQQFAPIIATAVGLYWAYLLIQRWRGDEDPSVRKQSSSGLGSMSFLVSGAYTSMMFASIIVIATWPMAVEKPLFGALVLGGVVFHSAMEKNEDMEAAS